MVAPTMILQPMDYVRAAIAQAMVENLTLDDLWRCAEHADTPETFDAAVNLLVTMGPGTAQP